MSSRTRSHARCRIPLALLLVLCGCTAESYERDADREVGSILRSRTESTLGGRETSVARPRSKTVADPAAQAHEQTPAVDAPTPVAAPTRMLSLRDSLEIAVRSNRELSTQRESLYLSALSLTGTQYAFSPRVSAVLSYLFAGSNDGPESHAPTFNAGVAQLLPWGGEASLTARSGFTRGPDSINYNSSVGIRLTQPLLRGAGREAAWEGLVQAERSVVYAVRDFELFRERFSIDVAARFYDLVQQKQAVENQRRNLEGFIFGRKQAEALFSVGRVKELEALRAKRNELTSRNDLIEAEENLRLALDRFRIFLGLPDSEPIDVLNEEPVFVDVNFDVGSAVQVALENRLDWINRQEQLEDARRGERIAANGLLPDLALDLGYTLAGEGESDIAIDNHAYLAGFTFRLPIQQINERNAYRASQIALVNATRAVNEFKDNLVVSVRSTFRELARRKESLDIQAELIADQVRNVKIAQLLFDQGNFSNRDVVEAQQALLDAQNALIQEKVSYEIARLGLLKDLGILFIDEKGIWKE